jgi:prepilin-type N-terminal cleavage/methylation domain-containing protein
MNNNSKANGFTLIETLVGVAVLLIVFMGIFGVYRLGMKVVFQSKARTISTSLANQKIEEIKNLSYGNVGTFCCHPEHLECEYGDTIGVINGVPAGPIKKEQTVVLNNINYTILTDIKYGINCSDGVGIAIGEECKEEYDDSCSEIPCPADDCPKDYKKAKVTISWGYPNAGAINLETSISPKTKEQECIETGGFLAVEVRDSLSQQSPYPQIDVENLLTYETKSESPEKGEYTFVLDPGTGIYKIDVSNGDGYTSVTTYGIGDEYQGQIIAVPFHPHASVIENDFWEESYYIDKNSSFSIETFSRATTENFLDLFANETNISDKHQVVISGGEIVLEESSPGIYYDTGYVISTEITPTNLILWEDVFISDVQPDPTEIRYHIWYDTGTVWQVIPDTYLPGNEIGFASSPINLFDLDPIVYPSIKIKANFLTIDTSFTPVLEDWKIVWSTTNSIPVGNVNFHMRSKGIVGKDSENFDIYRYSADSVTDGAGLLTLSNLQWDEYYFSNFSSSGSELTLAKTRPEMSAENSIYLPADTNKNIKLFLETPYSLLLEVNNSATGEHIMDASAHLYNIALGYDETQLTNPDGDTIFFNLDNDTYDLEISALGYQNYAGTVSISGKEVKIVELTSTP